MSTKEIGTISLIQIVKPEQGLPYRREIGYFPAGTHTLDPQIPRFKPWERKILNLAGVLKPLESIGGETILYNAINSAIDLARTEGLSGTYIENFAHPATIVPKRL